MGLARHALPRARDAALLAAGATLAASIGAALVGALTWRAPAPALEVPSAPAVPAPVEERIPSLPSAPAAPTQAPTLTAAPSAPAGETLPAEAPRKQFENVPIESANPSFRPGGNVPPPYPSIPPQD